MSESFSVVIYGYYVSEDLLKKHCPPPISDIVSATQEPLTVSTDSSLEEENDFDEDYEEDGESEDENDYKAHQYWQEKIPGLENHCGRDSDQMHYYVGVTIGGSDCGSFEECNEINDNTRKKLQANLDKLPQQLKAAILEEIPTPRIYVYDDAT